MEEAGAGQRGDLFGPLRVALDRVTELGQLVKGFKLGPSETELKDQQGAGQLQGQDAIPDQVSCEVG
jgi:hypothetical protein